MGRGSRVVAKLLKSNIRWRGALKRATVFYEPDEVLAYHLTSGQYVPHDRIEKVLYNAPVEPMTAVPDDLADSWSSWPEQMLVGDNGKIMTDPVALREMLLEAGKTEADVGTDQKVIVRLAHSHLADLSSQYVKWAMAQLNPEA